MLCQLRFVPRVTQHRMPRLGKVNTNLITPASFESHLHHGGPFQVRHDTVMRDRQLTDRFVVRELLC